MGKENKEKREMLKSRMDEFIEKRDSGVTIDTDDVKEYSEFSARYNKLRTKEIKAFMSIPGKITIK